MNNQNIGMVYVATRRPYYLAEACLSAHSARAFIPDLPITLYTDLPGVPFARSPCFSTVVPLETRRRYRSLWAEGQLDRIRALRNSPYDYTLHLDTDTRVLSPEFPELFRKLDEIDIGMAVCQPDVSRCAQVTGLPMFNVGFILFRKSPPVLALLEAWENLTRENFELGNQDVPPATDVTRHIEDPEARREILFMDQTSFVQLLSPRVNRFNVRLEIMDEAWNFRSTGRNRTFDRPVKISHHPELRERLGGDVIALAGNYLAAGNAPHALELLQCLHDELVPAENESGRAHVRALIDQVRRGL